jgi:hypothetical protein
MPAALEGMRVRDVTHLWRCMVLFDRIRVADRPSRIEQKGA